MSDPWDVFDTDPAEDLDDQTQAKNAAVEAQFKDWVAGYFRQANPHLKGGVLDASSDPYQG